MKNKFTISLISFFIFSFTTVIQAQMSCLEVLSELSITTEHKNISTEPILTVDGDTYWGYYKCLRCGERTSAKPNIHNDQACYNCGAGHTTEKYSPPALFKKDGNIYLVDPGRLVTSHAEMELAESGETESCPFCGNSQFQIDTECVTCGARAENPSDIKQSMKELSRGNTSATAKTPHMDLSLSSLRETRNRTNKKFFTSVAAVLTVSAAFGTVWGFQTYTTEAHVTSFDKKEVVVSYESKKGALESLTLGRSGIETQPWRVGDTLELYFINWSTTPKAAERLDGNVFKPVKN